MSVLTPTNWNFLWSSDKGHFVATPSAPAQNWLCWNALIAAEQKDAYVPLSPMALHCFFVVLVLKLPVSPLRVLTVAEHGPTVTLHSEEAVVCVRQLPLPAAHSEKHLWLVQIPSVCACVAGTDPGSSPRLESHSEPGESIKCQAEKKHGPSQGGF